MKINANPMAAFNREAPKTGPAARAERSEALPTDAKTKTAPPGLERALARLQAIEQGDRTPGQTNAMSQIERNLARYVETQSIVATPAPTPTSIVPSPAEPLPPSETPTALEAETSSPVLEQAPAQPLEQALGAEDGSVSPETEPNALDDAALVEALLGTAQPDEPSAV